VGLLEFLAQRPVQTAQDAVLFIALSEQATNRGLIYKLKLHTYQQLGLNFRKRSHRHGDVPHEFPVEPRARPSASMDGTDTAARRSWLVRPNLSASDMQAVTRYASATRSIALFHAIKSR
jgi:hypothetical protein